MHVLLWAEDSEAELRSELAQSSAREELGGAGACTDRAVPPAQSALVCVQACSASVPWPHLAFARQLLPDAVPVRADSIRAWADRAFEAMVEVLPDGQPWSLHVEPHYGTRAVHRMGARAWHSLARKGDSGAAAETRPTGKEDVAADAGRHRCTLIREALVEMLQKKRRHLLRRLRREPRPFTAQDSLVQVLLTAPDSGFLSVAPAPLPYAQRHLVAPFPKGEVPIAADKAAPSRAFAKLVEAELRLGRGIQQGETCVDLGAAPGSWTYVAVSRGGRVIAVDRSPLREDLMRSPHVEFRPGDAFRFQPARPVDWLLCDVIAAPERSADLLLDWLRRGWCRQFVVTLKLGKGPMAGGEVGGLEVLARLKAQLPPLTSELFLTRLCANKREVCAFGKAR